MTVVAGKSGVTEAVQSVGGCGAVSPDGERACILELGHGPHGWEPASEPAWWGSDCTACGNTTVNTMTCSECGTSDNTIRLWFYDDDVLETTEGL